MAELLLELFSEEIPARLQAKAAEDLKSLITNGLVDAGLTYQGAQFHATPRRLVLSVEGLQAQAADTREELRGPKDDASASAIDGFMKKLGVNHPSAFAQISALRDLPGKVQVGGAWIEIRETPKGKFYYATVERPGRTTVEIIAGLVPEVIRKFPWSKPMRWGAGTLKWVRPLHSILCTFDGEVVPFDVDGIASGNTTRGHRFLSKGVIEARRFEDYAAKLHKAHVIVDATARAETIRHDARSLAMAQGLEMIEDEGLLKEVAGLVEWPVVLMGEFDDAYLSVPPEVIITTIKANQKCFCLKDLKTGKLANKYLLVSNMIATDGGKEIVRGNNKVIAARLSDAKFFWDTDRKIPLADNLAKLDSITFHAKLGTEGERVKRIEALAGEIAKTIGADVEKAKLAARLAKTDRVSGVVGEFPELQGLMGRYYALDQGVDAEVADAIRDHYKPQGPSDGLPQSKIGMAVALADKLDTLVGFWAIDEKPTGSKDPYALRRAALGVVRIAVESGLRLPLLRTLECSHDYFVKRYQELYVLCFRSETGSFRSYPHSLMTKEPAKVDPYWWLSLEVLGNLSRGREWFDSIGTQDIFDESAFVHFGEMQPTAKSLLSFFADRLKVYLKDQGMRHDLIDAVFSLGGQDDLLMVVKRVEALSKFLETDDGKNLLAGVKRAANILRIEEKKDGRTYSGDVHPQQLIKGEEKALHSAITQAAAQARKAVEHEDFEAAMRAIAKLRAPVDEFFEGVTVNDKDATFRENRLRLLNRIREACSEVADFSRIEG